MRREADVDRQHPELLEHLQDARLGRDRQREDHEVDAGAAREFDEVVDRAELLQAGAGGGRAVVAAVVEHADKAHIRLALALQRGDEMLARIAAADHDRAAVEPAFAGPAAHDAVQKQAQAIEREQADAVVAREPEAGIHAAELREERDRDDHQKDDGPRDGEPRALADRIAESLDLIDVGGLERDHRKAGNRERGRDVVPVEDLAVSIVDITEIRRDADQRDQRELGRAHHSGDDDRGERRHDVLRGDKLRERGELRLCARP